MSRAQIEMIRAWRHWPPLVMRTNLLRQWCPFSSPSTKSSQSKNHIKVSTCPNSPSVWHRTAWRSHGRC